jgi:4-amino-4-deoxy-L-arabinose transferase-like glycosyltransferase
VIGGIAPALISGLAALALLGPQLAADPAPGFTFSFSPYTDEGWIALGARNLALLGTWSTDELHLYLVQLPFAVATYLVFEILGVGIVQARLVSLICSVGAVALLAGFVGRRFGALPGLAAGIGLATSTLFLYYGRLVLLEPMVTLFLIAGLVLLLAAPQRVGYLLGIAGGGALAIAIGTKASALFAAGGLMLGMLMPREGRTGGLPIRLGAAVAVAVTAGLVFGLFVALFRGEEMEAVLRFLAQERLPASLEELWDRTVGYVFEPWASDGAIAHSASLLVGGAAGLGLSAWRWRRMDRAQQLLVAAAIGWFAVGAGLLLLVSYRPNRYVVPILPPLAILSAAGLAVLLDLLPRRVLQGVLAVAVVVLLTAPGLFTWSGWMAGATHRVTRIQAELLGNIDDGAAMQGDLAPLFGMRVPVPAIVSRPEFGFNDGDLYTSHGVRWVFVWDDSPPAWIDAHPGAWAAREKIGCWPWRPPLEVCLYHLP